jgi:CubicO group peptidase (beta-lactamase class C family)
VLDSSAEGEVEGQVTYVWPVPDWQEATPEEEGIDSGALADLLDSLAADQIQLHSLLAVRHGKLVLEVYPYPFFREMRHEVESVAKSILSATTGAALDHHLLASIDAPMLSYFSDRQVQNLDDDKRAITLRHLLSQSSGLGWIEETLYDANRIYAAWEASSDRVQFVLDLPMIGKPGASFHYGGGNPHVMSAVLTKASQRSAFDLAKEYLFAPLGIQDVAWNADDQGISRGDSDALLRPRDMAKIGYLYLRRGEWNGKRVLPESWIAESTRPFSYSENGEQYGYLWWIPTSESVFLAIGFGEQYIIVSRDADMVVVMNAAELKHLASYALSIADAIRSPQAIAANPAAARRLADKIAAMQKAPDPASVPSLPALAGSLSNKIFEITDNPFGIRTLGLSFAGSEGRLALELKVRGQERKLDLPIGLDGVYRITHAKAVDDLPTSYVATGFKGFGVSAVALRGGWSDDRTFTIEYQELGVATSFLWTLAFDESTMSGSIVNSILSETSTWTGIAVK